MTRRLVLDLVSLPAGDADRLRTALSLMTGSGRDAPMIEGRRHAMRIVASDGSACIEVPFALLPEWIATAKRRRMDELRAYAASIATDLTAPTTSWILDDPDGSSLARRYDGWTTFQLIAEALVPDFLEQIPSARDGSPWRSARCSRQFGDRGMILPDEIVEHAFASHPHVLEFERSADDVMTGTWKWSIRDRGGLGFEAIPPHPVSTLRLLASLPSHLRGGLVP